MSKETPNYVICQCQHCGGNIEFDAHQVGDGETRVVQCPHCGLETKLSIQPTMPGAALTSSKSSPLRHSLRYTVLPLIVGLSLVGVFILIAQHESEQKKIEQQKQHQLEEKRVQEKAQREAEQEKVEEENLQDLLHPERDPKFRVNELIESISEVVVEQIKYRDFLAKEGVSQTEDGSNIVERVIRELKKETQDVIAIRKSDDEKYNRPYRERITSTDVDQVNSWENGMEQKILDTAIEATKHGASEADIENAIMWTIQLKKDNR